MKMDTTCISKYNVFHQSLKHRFSEYFNFILFIKQIKEQNNQMHIKFKKKPKNSNLTLSDIIIHLQLQHVNYI